MQVDRAASDQQGLGIYQQARRPSPQDQPSFRTPDISIISPRGTVANSPARLGSKHYIAGYAAVTHNSLGFRDLMNHRSCRPDTALS